ncbi:hypothetical protein V1477_014477 [Vespula maculifrons]|uniref:Uncharacterized protein n=1 Tax=Vespula maculifrons TaxID=7453 RepID=A0ABD2BHJ5_VESMC
MRPVRNRDPSMLCGSWGCSINCVMQASFPPTHKLFEQVGRVEKRSRAAAQIDFVGSSAKILCPMTNVGFCLIFSIAKNLTPTYVHFFSLLTIGSIFELTRTDVSISWLKPLFLIEANRRKSSGESSAVNSSIADPCANILRKLLEQFFFQTVGVEVPDRRRFLIVRTLSKIQLIAARRLTMYSRKMLFKVDSCNSAFQYYLYCGVYYDLVPCTVQNKINSIEAHAICAYCFNQNN